MLDHFIRSFDKMIISMWPYHVPFTYGTRRLFTSSFMLLCPNFGSGGSNLHFALSVHPFSFCDTRSSKVFDLDSLNLTGMLLSV
jgi:hypothetical protein